MITVDLECQTSGALSEVLLELLREAAEEAKETCICAHRTTCALSHRRYKESEKDSVTLRDVSPVV